MNVSVLQVSCWEFGLFFMEASGQMLSATHSALQKMIALISSSQDISEEVRCVRVEMTALQQHISTVHALSADGAEVGW